MYETVYLLYDMKSYECRLVKLVAVHCNAGLLTLSIGPEPCQFKYVVGGVIVK